MRPVLFLQFDGVDMGTADMVNREEFDFIRCINQYDFDNTDLNRYGGLLIPMSIDQYILQRNGKRIQQFLEAGGRVFHSGHIILPYLACLSEYKQLVPPKWRDFMVTQLMPHPVYEGYNASELSMNRGVAGFYSRGSNPPPVGARVITAIRNGTVPVDWEFDVGDGMLYVHAGNDLYHCSHDSKTVLHLFRNTVRYLGAE
ncbi:MAG: hypothetical protein IJ191_05320 [Treponema sp.]|nr:hypothetical protein [Treponema sp.]